MKTFARLLALALALVLALSLTAADFAETEAADDSDPVLFTLDGEEFRLSTVDGALYNMYVNGYVDDLYDYDTVIEALIENRVLNAKITELGLDQFTPDEEEALEAEAAATWQEALDSYVEYYLTEDTEEARAACYEEAEQYFYIYYGYTLETMKESVKINETYNRLEAYILENAEHTVSEDEINQIFLETAESDREMYEGNIFNYEFYVLYYGYDTWYVPEGYRGIIHILLKPAEELLTAYADAQALYEEEPTDENKAAVDAAHDAIIASKQDVIDEIYARLENGESFVDLIAEYGEDPGMEIEQQLAEGYPVHIESILWDPAFIEAAFSEKMQQPGDVSDPVVGQNGIHILYYLRDVPSGIVEMNDAIREEISAYLEDNLDSQALNAAVDQWVSEHEIVYNQDAIDAAKAQ